MKNLDGKLSVTRPHLGDGVEEIRITLKCSLSRAVVAEISIDPATFAKAITGLGELDVKFDSMNLDKVGKLRVVEKRSIECPINTYQKDKLSSWLKENAKEDGWIVNSYLGSQGSVVRSGEKTILNYSVTKFITVG